VSPRTRKQELSAPRQSPWDGVSHSTLSSGALLGATLLLIGLSSAPFAQARASATPGVVLNEIMYHPPGDRDDLQYVELLNASPTSVNLSGWSFVKGVEFVFPHGTELLADGCLVVCRDIAAFKAQYGTQVNVAGAFMGKLSHKGERVELADAQGQPVDTVNYGDRPPWPLGADGYGASLERICPAAPGDDPANWAASAVKPGEPAKGTPGRRNSCFSAVPLPRISEVRFDKAEPGNPIAVTAAVADAAGVQSVALAWATWPGGGASVWSEVPMKLQSGDAHQGVYAGNIPAQPEERLIRFTIHAQSASGMERLCPAKTEPRPTFACATFVNTNTAQVPFLKLLTAGGVEPGPAQGPHRSSRLGKLAKADLEDSAKSRSTSDNTAIYLPPGGKQVQVFDYVRVRPRRGGLKVHFHADQPFSDMTGINLVFKGSPRYLLTEPLADELYRRTGVPVPATQHVRLWLDRRPLGYHLLVEQPNKSFLRRQGRAANGDLYKLLWYEYGLIAQHDKKTNPQTGHQDLVRLVEGLNRTSGIVQWDFIQQHFNVDEMINCYAVSMCIQDWDGFFNNYYTYHDLRPGGKWEVIPWDKDKTWGDYDGASRQYDWYEMPLTLGMNGDKSVKRPWFGGWPVAGAEWWRPPGYFSGPLLANPEFRRRFLSRLREVCETIFTPEEMGPVIRSLETRLEAEVRVRAQMTRQDPAAAVAAFKNDIQSFHNQVAHRRKFILEQLASQK
jgi:hypothetical protein